MRNIIVSEMISLDGFFAGSDGNIDWHVTDDEFNDYAADLIDSVDTMLFGRVTYELMASYWPTPTAIANDPVIANRMNSTPKIVFSKTLEKAAWENTRLISSNAAQEVAALKQHPGKDMVIYGSGGLVSSLTQRDLIDEYHLIVVPVVLVSGQTLFTGVQDQLKLKLIQTRTFKSGNVLLCYQPDKSA